LGFLAGQRKHPPWAYQSKLRFTHGREVTAKNQPNVTRMLEVTKQADQNDERYWHT
jgi:hypothetical protein